MPKNPYWSPALHSRVSLKSIVVASTSRGFRAILLLAFCGLLLQAWVDRPKADQNPNSSRWQTLSMAAIEASQGRLLQLQPGVSLRHSSYEDLGMPVMVGLSARFLPKGVIGPDEIAWTFQYKVMFGLFVWYLILAILPRRSIIECLALASAPLILFHFRVLNWHWDNYWAPALAVIVVLTVQTSTDYQTWKRGILAVGGGVLVGLLWLIRQDAGLIAVATVAIVACLEFVFEPRQRFWKISMVVENSAILFILAAFLPQLLLNMGFRLHGWQTGVDHFVGFGSHGIWHNLFIGIGALSQNPWGILWDDKSGFIHAISFDPQVTWNSQRYMDDLKSALFQVIRSDPWAFVDVAMAKFMHLLRLVPMEAAIFAILVGLSRIIVAAKRAGESIGWASLTFILFVSAMAPPVLGAPFREYSKAVRCVALVVGLVECARLLVALSGSAVKFSSNTSQKGKWIFPCSAVVGALGAFLVGASILFVGWEKGWDSLVELARTRPREALEAALERSWYVLQSRPVFHSRIKESGIVNPISESDSARLPAAIIGDSLLLVRVHLPEHVGIQVLFVAGTPDMMHPAAIYCRENETCPIALRVLSTSEQGDALAAFRLIEPLKRPDSVLYIHTTSLDGFEFTSGQRLRLKNLEASRVLGRIRIGGHQSNTPGGA